MLDGDITAEQARAAWDEYERQLYAAAVADTSRYEQAILAVRAVVDNLRTITSIEQLVSKWSRGDVEFDAVISATIAAPGALLGRQIAGAAFALRGREIKELALRQVRLQRIEDARRSGNAWVFLEESGNLQSGLVAPYHSTEMHLPTGLALISLVQQAPSLGTPIFAIAVVRLDPRSGDLVDATPGIADWTEHDKLEDFVAYRAALRDRVGTAT